MLAAALILASGAVAETETPSRYPLEPVWQAFVSYCADRGAGPSDWRRAEAEPSTVLENLSVNRVVPRAQPTKFPVSYRLGAGRELYGIKRVWDNPSMARRFHSCEVYDLGVRSEVDLAPIAALSGSEPARDDREYSHTFTWDGGFAPSHERASVTLQLPGGFPNPDTVGFVGLRFSVGSSESL
jgi:hypothetical protein